MEEEKLVPRTQQFNQSLCQLTEEQRVSYDSILQLLYKCGSNFEITLSQQFETKLRIKEILLMVALKKISTTEFFEKIEQEIPDIIDLDMWITLKTFVGVSNLLNENQKKSNCILTEMKNLFDARNN